MKLFKFMKETTKRFPKLKIFVMLILHHLLCNCQCCHYMYVLYLPVSLGKTPPCYKSAAADKLQRKIGWFAY